MNFNEISKQEFLFLLEQDGLEICQNGKDAFLDFEGSIFEYFKSHERGQNAVNYCAKSNWFRENAPQEILDLVTHLYLSENNLTSFPTKIGNWQKLTRLDLIKNNLTSLPTEIGNCKKLKYLYLQDNNFSEQEKQKIKALLPNCEIYF